jgi:cell wall-associated NlpC family hydrolase
MSPPREDEAYGTVSIPVADLRREPADAPGTDGRDDGRQSQLLYNEVLRVMEEQGDWLRVEAIEQQKFLGPVGWGGYPGWVRKGAVAKVEKPPGHNASIKNARAAVADGPSPKAALLFYLSLGTRLATRGETEGFLEIPLPDGKAGWVSKKDVAITAPMSLAGQCIGPELIRLARLFLGVPYLWGGRSMPLPTSPTDTGVDCSGLVNLVFRALGKDVPRDALDLWLASVRLGADELQAGDLVFLSREGEPESIDHVLLSLGDEELIEAPATGDIVRIRSFSDKLGCDLSTLRRHDHMIKGRKVYFGRISGPAMPLKE